MTSTQGFWEVAQTHAFGLSSHLWLLAPDTLRFSQPKASFTGRGVGRHSYVPPRV